MSDLRCVPILLLLLAAVVGTACSPAGASGEIVFRDVEEQTRQFMEWERTIELTAQQDAVKREALGNLPAPCCSDKSAYTCCCSCNVSRTIWGLSHYLIANKEASAEQVRTKVQEWIQFVNPAGFSGTACYQGGCRRPFRHDGCGGMNPNQVTF